LNEGLRLDVYIFKVKVHMKSIHSPVPLLQLITPIIAD
jgi:hypothetical protein